MIKEEKKEGKREEKKEGKREEKKEGKRETCLIFGFIFLYFCDVRKLFFPMCNMGE